jgi:hypothetical protein
VDIEAVGRACDFLIDDILPMTRLVFGEAAWPKAWRGTCRRAQ